MSENTLILTLYVGAAGSLIILTNLLLLIVIDGIKHAWRKLQARRSPGV